jgi:hypothetical protein
MMPQGSAQLGCSLHGGSALRMDRVAKVIGGAQGNPQAARWGTNFVEQGALQGWRCIRIARCRTMRGIE